ncbi:HpcH/HpaI aldolase/citrate lyase family protein [Cohnella sp. GCM10027633]|uniref:HpcH/HpaI aldolase family protein n=1 Tax=unclassified Cohnella TaxID=2636738 RepID=UPI003643E5C8
MKQKLRDGVPAFGLFASIPHPIVVEMIGHAEYDFVIIDREHATTTMDEAENMIRAAELMDVTPLVRVSGVDRTAILQALDSGAQGIVIPHVESRGQVEEAVRHAYYAPIGARSLNSGRAGAFAKHSLAEYVVRANEEVLVVPMIESAAGVDNREAILSAPGVGFVLEGAADLSQSLGFPWDTEHPEVKRRLGEVRETARRLGVPCAAVSRHPEEMREQAIQGVRAFVLGDDRNTAFRAYRQKRDDYATIIKEVT